MEYIDFENYLMKNQSLWEPSKFVVANGQLVANPDSKHVSISSQLNVNLLGASLNKALSQFAQGRLLDLGCGSVPLFSAYRQQVTEIMCVDWANSAHDMRHLDLVADLNVAIPIKSGRFETVILTDVIEHISAPEQLLHEIRRLLCSGGVVIGSVPFLYWLHEEPHDYYRYTIHTLRALAKRHGFIIEVLAPYGSGTDVLFDVLGKLLVNVHWRLGPKLAGWSQKLGALARKSTFIQKINDRSQSMPIGYVFVFRAT